MKSKKEQLIEHGILIREAVNIARSYERHYVAYELEALADKIYSMIPEKRTRTGYAYVFGKKNGRWMRSSIYETRAEAEIAASACTSDLLTSIAKIEWEEDV
jgi:hypothetical protein